MAGPYPPEPQRELWQPPAGWAAPTKPVASWYDKGERLTPAVKSWFDAGLRLKPTGWGLRSEQLAEADGGAPPAVEAPEAVTAADLAEASAVAAMSLMSADDALAYLTQQKPSLVEAGVPEEEVEQALEVVRAAIKADVEPPPATPSLETETMTQAVEMMPPGG